MGRNSYGDSSSRRDRWFSDRSRDAYSRRATTRLTACITGSADRASWPTRGPVFVDLLSSEQVGWCHQTFPLLTSSVTVERFDTTAVAPTSINSASVLFAV